MDPVAFVFSQLAIVFVPGCVMSYIAYRYANERWELGQNADGKWIGATLVCLILGIVGGCWLYYNVAASFWLACIVVPFSGLAAVGIITGFIIGMIRLKRYAHNLGVAMREDDHDGAV